MPGFMVLLFFLYKVNLSAPFVGIYGRVLRAPRRAFWAKKK